MFQWLSDVGRPISCAGYQFPTGVVCPRLRYMQGHVSGFLYKTVAQSFPANNAYPNPNFSQVTELLDR